MTKEEIAVGGLLRRGQTIFNVPEPAGWGIVPLGSEEWGQGGVPLSEGDKARFPLFQGRSRFNFVKFLRDWKLNRHVINCLSDDSSSCSLSSTAPGCPSDPA